MLPIFRSTIAGRPVKVDPKRLVANLGSLAAKRPGPPPDPITRKIRGLDHEAVAKGRHLTDGAIAAKVYGAAYRDCKDSLRKRELRDAVKDRRRSM